MHLAFASTVCARSNLASTTTWDVIVVEFFCGENLLRIGFDIAFLFLLLIVADGEVIILALIPFMRVSLTFAPNIKISKVSSASSISPVTME